MPRARLLALLLAAALAGCGGDDEAAPSAASTPPPAAETDSAPVPVEPPAGDGGGASPYIGSLTVDPGDGTLMIGTGLGLYRLAPGEREARALTGRLETPDGAGPVSANLELIYAGPGELLASGHPAEAGTLPEDLGLMRSGDAGETWTPVSGLGRFDYHVLALAGDTLAGVPADTTDLQVSTDGGASFAPAGVAPAPPEDVEIDPADPSRWALASADGIATSRDGGGSWRPRDAVAGAHLAWPEPGALYRVDPNGATWASADGGETWEERGNAGGAPNTLTADARGALYVSMAGAVIKRSRDAGRTWQELVTLR